jgi:two-component system CheB/CheR fusion protein
MDGHQFIFAIRQMPQFEMTPAIALTGYATAGDQEKKLQAGFDNHVGKPISHDTFVDIIDEVYRNKAR